MVDLLDILLSIILELLPAIGEMLPGKAVKSTATTQKTFKTTTSRKHALGQDRSADHQ